MKILHWIVVFVCTSLVQSESNTGAQIPVKVRRRQSADIFTNVNSTSSSGVHCDAVNNTVTYLVTERRCVKNEELFSDACSSAIVPTGLSSNFTSIAILDPARTLNITSLLTTPHTDAKFTFSGTDELVNNSLCQIASLEVFRGWKEAIVVDHDGFSLTINGVIEINKDELAYSIEDFTGELYRMNLTCSGKRLPTNGCLFFKVSGIAFVNSAKFNCTVPGTLVNFIEECNITTTGNPVSETTSNIVTTSATTVEFENSSDFTYGSRDFYVVVGCGALLCLACVLAIFVVCLIVCLLRRKRRPHKSQTAPLGEERQEIQRQDLVTDSKTENIYHTLTPPECTTVLNDTNTESHTYAVLEKPQSHVTTNNPYEYEDPVKGIPKSNKNISNVLQEQGVSNALFHHYDNTIRVNLVKGHSNPSEHVYAVLEREQKQQLPTTVNVYDQPPIEDTDKPALALEKPSDIHTYAELQKPKQKLFIQVQASTY